MNTTGTTGTSFNFTKAPIGICSICGGTVLQEALWVGFIPEARCESCGAVRNPMPVIPMIPAPQKIDYYEETTAGSHPDCVEITTTDGKNVKVW